MIVVRRTYIPKPGQGGKLLALVQKAAHAMGEAGYRKPHVYRAWHGAHGTVYTDQQWESITDYEESRSAVRKNSDITSVFEQIYPLLAETHDTQILESAE